MNNGYVTTFSGLIFFSLVLLVALMMAFPYPVFLMIGFILVPALIISQVLLVLRGPEPNQQSDFSEDQWYEHK